MQPNDVVKIIGDNLDVKVNWAKFHNNKYRAGHIIGNKFKVLISELRNSNHAIEKSMKIAEAIHSMGVPNYYGEQRIGRGGKNVLEGWAILHGQKKFKDKWLSKLLVSAYQSYLCNRYLTHRVEKGCFYSLVKGDIAKKHDTGGLFIVEDPEIEQTRYESKEISFTAPIFGYKMMQEKCRILLPYAARRPSPLSSEKTGPGA